MADAKPQDIASMNLWQKLAAITGDLKPIAKDGKNREQGYGFIEYAAVAGQLRELFGKYHVVCMPHMGKRDVQTFKTAKGNIGTAVSIEFRFEFKNADAPTEIEVIEWIGEAIDYGDKATNKAATSALKYCLMRTFNVSEQGEVETDHTTTERGENLSPEPQRVTMKDSIADAYRKMEAHDITNPDERKKALLIIAGIEDASQLTGQIMTEVHEVLDTRSDDELLDLLTSRMEDEQ